MIWPLGKKQHETLFPDVELHTPRLILRPARLQDYLQWKAVRMRNYPYLKPYEPAWPDGCLTADFFARRITRLAQDWRKDRTYAFLIFIKESGALAGAMNINNVARGAANCGSLGYWIDEALQGKGYMTETARGVIDYAFSALSLSRMNAATLPHNKKSRAMLERVGFIEEGFAKSYIQIDGRRQDHVLYGLNAADFKPAR